MIASLIEVAQDSLTQPPDSAWWDDELFVTHGLAFAYAVNSGDTLEESNFQVISADLLERFPDDIEVIGSNHWAVGPLDQIKVRVLKQCNATDKQLILNSRTDINEDNITDAFLAVYDWLVKLDDYPVADEMHWSQLEAEQNSAWLESELEYIEKWQLSDEQVWQALSDNDIDGPDSLYDQDLQDIITEYAYDLAYAEAFAPDPNQIELFDLEQFNVA